MSEAARVSIDCDDSLAQYARPYLVCLGERAPQLERFLRRKGFPPQVASDAAEEALSVAYKLITARKVESLGEGRRPWLIRVAFRKACNLCCRGWSRIVLLAPDALDAYSFAEEVGAPRHNAAIHAALDRLPPDQRDLVAFVYLQGHTKAEAVERFELTPAAVHGRLYRAKNLLRSELLSSLEF